MLDVLALSPHPDDVELCCGGVLAKMSRRGYNVGIVDLTKGEIGTEGTAEIRVQEAAKAAEILGVKVRENMDFGDCKLSSSFGEAKKLADVIRDYAPPLLLAPYGDNQHPDHAAASLLARKAAFFAKLPRITTGHEAHEVEAVAYYMLHTPFDPTFVVNVTESYDKKLEAIKAYKSQRKLILSSRGLLDAVKSRDKFYGSRVGVEFSEPFFCDTMLKIDDPVAFFK